MRESSLSPSAGSNVDDLPSLWIEHMPATEPGGSGPNPRVLSLGELLLVPRPKFLVEGVLVEGSLACLFGPAGSYKTFVAIDMACCIADGRQWHGHRVEPGDVLFVAAEGFSGLGSRVLAWCGGEVPKAGSLTDRFHVYSEALDLSDPESVTRLLEALMGLPSPKLVVIDTLPRSMSGDENSSDVMGGVVASCDRIRQAGPAVMLVHHTRKSGADERGSSALRGAADTMVRVSKVGSGLTLTCAKQKEAEEFDDTRFNTELVQLEIDDEHCTSLRVVDHEGLTSINGGQVKMGAHESKILATLISQAPPEGLSSGELEEACEDIKSATFSRHLGVLRERGYVRFERKGKRHLYCPTEKGKAQRTSRTSSSINTPHESRSSSEDNAHHTPSLLEGVSDERRGNAGCSDECEKRSSQR